MHPSSYQERRQLVHAQAWVIFIFHENDSFERKIRVKLVSKTILNRHFQYFHPVFLIFVNFRRCPIFEEQEPTDIKIRCLQGRVINVYDFEFSIKK